MSKQEAGTEIVPLVVDTSLLPQANTIQGNLAEVQRMCIEIASAFNIAPTIKTSEDYKSAKARLAYWRKCSKQVDDERKRVKTAYLAPLTTFEAGVKSSVSALTEAIDKQDRIVKDFEKEARVKKRERLEQYWEQTYPAYATCAGDAKEPLVPFARIENPDWTKRMSEIDSDKAGCEAMDAVAAELANGESILERFGEEIRVGALSELYRTLDLNTAIQRAEAEQRRREEIARARAQVQPKPEPVIANNDQVTPSPQQPQNVPAPTPAPTPAPAPVTVPRETKPAEPVCIIEIPVYDEAECEHVVAIMRANGIHGRVHRC
ncbi:DUF1351 domain-containing protein [Collinsella sp. AGMB00827]|uniref:DUF1351 domain-containing protein n=1 Tax=Collinsella ureilytica TaxID=2869515 RepID=A0ABS7MLT8_9ACTN|nr:DUF1351 domain-containing protein [Collinsella urealyticum]MBY4798329.1 DUF1351 domain-containing protein [Collinsella urealyticum]